MNRRIALFCAVAVAALVTSAVRADHGFYGFGFPYYGHGNYGAAAYALGNVPTPPYFALHPPVYYSHSIARPYGNSPFACSCGCHHRKHESARKVWMNPYMESLPVEILPKTEAKTETKTEAKSTSHFAAVPKRMANPFFVATIVDETKLAAQEE